MSYNHNPNSKPWSNQELFKLFLYLKRDKLSQKQIASLMKRNYDSINAKARRHNWDTLLSCKELSEKDKKCVKDILYNQTVSKMEITEITPDDHLDDHIDKTKKDIQKSFDTKVFNELLKNRAAAEIIADKISSVVESLPSLDHKKINIPKIKIEKNSEEAAVLVLSDLHCGLVATLEETGGFADYNIETFKNRCNNIIKSVTKITTLHRRSYPINTLNIFLLGDLIQGMSGVGKWSPVHIQTDALSQIFECMQELEKMFATFSLMFENIEIHTVYGNHGKMAHKGEEKDYLNWDYIAYLFLEKSLKNQENIKFHNTKSWFQLVEIMGQKFVITHGEDIRGWNGLPFYGMQRAESRYKALFDQFKNYKEAYDVAKPYLDQLNKNPNNDDAVMGLIKSLLVYSKSFDNLILAHFHLPASFATNSGGKIIVNGSFVGGDNYSLKSLQSACKPTQKFFGVHKEGISWTYDLDLLRSNEEINE